MRAFAELFERLDRTTRRNAKIASLVDYFRSASAADAAWAFHFLAGGRAKRLVGSRSLRSWTAEEAGIPDWLFEESYGAVGDLAETIALLLPPGMGTDEPLHDWVENRLLPLKGLDEETQRPRVLAAWRQLDTTQLLIWNKLMTGAFRVGASRRLVLRALEAVSGVDRATLEHRSMGHWRPSAESYRLLIDADTRDSDPSRPYPFFLAHPLEAEPRELGPVAEWQAEWKWDGIRAQLVRRGGAVYLWSRGEELMTDRYPEVATAAKELPDGTVLDGELLAWRDGGPMPFAALQRRIGRKQVGPKLLAEVPVSMMTYDLLELAGQDVRGRPLDWRRAELRRLVATLAAGGPLLTSPRVDAADWEELARLRETSRERRTEGLMLKRRSAPYRVGRPRGDWWKWKVDPYTVDAVMLYAQRGHGRRASLYTDYTFGVWDGDRLVPFAKAYSGLTDAEIREVDRFVRRNTVERFGPVRSVRPELVFEIAFESIQASKRHKSGIAVRFPRIARWRRDKRPEAADSLAAVRSLAARGEEP